MRFLGVVLLVGFGSSILERVKLAGFMVSLLWCWKGIAVLELNSGGFCDGIQMGWPPGIQVVIMTWIITWKETNIWRSYFIIAAK